MQSPEAVARSWYERVWNRKDRDAIAELLAPNGVFHDGAIVTVGVGPFQQFYDRMHAALSDIHIEVEDTVVQGDKVCVRWSSTATHTGEGLGTSPAGVKVHVTGISLIRVENGKFLEAWQNWDMLGLMEQIKGPAESGVMPPTYVTDNL